MITIMLNHWDQMKLLTYSCLILCHWNRRINYLMKCFPGSSNHSLVTTEPPSQFQMWKQLELQQSSSPTTTFIWHKGDFFSRETNRNEQTAADPTHSSSAGCCCVPTFTVTQPSMRRLYKCDLLSWSCQASAVAGRPKKIWICDHPCVYPAIRARMSRQEDLVPGTSGLPEANVRGVGWGGGMLKAG